jgi:capsular polysaccharide biosynthesis protein
VDSARLAGPLSGGSVALDERAAFKTIAHAVRYHLYLLIAIIALFVLAAGAATYVRPPTYQGTALLFVDERFNSSQGFDLALQAGELMSAHFIQAATSGPVLDRACSGKYFDTAGTATFTCTAGGLGPHVSANTVKGTSWIAVNADARSSVESAARANAVARAMLDQNQADIAALLKPTSDYLQSELIRLDTAIAAEQAAIALLPPVPAFQPAIAGHQATLTLLQSQYSATYGRAQDLVLQQNRLTGSLTLVQQAAPPARPIDPDLVRYLAAGLVAGLCVALFVVLLVDRFDDRLYETEALAHAAGTRLVVAVSQKDSKRLSNHASEPYALARANLLAQHPRLSKVLVVAASSRDRVRPVAAGLGLAGVKAGQRVLVVDADAQTYVMHQQAGRNGSKMTIVSAPSRGDARIASEALADADDNYDLTIMSAPSPDRDPTAVSLAHTADIAIVVATARSTRLADVRRTADSLRMAGIQVAASILATDSVKEAELPRSEQSQPELYEAAANQWRLPTWRGPGGS